MVCEVSNHCGQVPMRTEEFAKDAVEGHERSVVSVASVRDLKHYLITGYCSFAWSWTSARGTEVVVGNAV